MMINATISIIKSKCIIVVCGLPQHHIGFHEEQRFTHHRGGFQLPGDRPRPCRVSLPAFAPSILCLMAHNSVGVGIIWF